MIKKLLATVALAGACTVHASAADQRRLHWEPDYEIEGIHRDTITSTYEVDGICYNLFDNFYELGFGMDIEIRKELMVTNKGKMVIVSHGWDMGPDPYAYFYKIEEKFYTGNLTIPSEVFIEELGTTLPVTSVAMGAFVDNPDLESVTLPSSVVTIGQLAFAYNPNLKSVNITGNVTVLPPGLFSGCTSLTSFDVPESVMTVYISAFYGSGVESLTFSENLNVLYQDAFDGADKLKSITINNKSTPQLLGTHGPSYKLYAPEGCVLYVPQDGVEAYKASAVWSNFADIRAIGSAAIGEVEAAAADIEVPAYNLLGQPVAKPRPGDIIIRNGRKVIAE